MSEVEENYKYTSKFDQASYRAWEESEYNAESQQNYYREAAQKMLRVLHAALSESNKNEASWWAVAFAISHPYCVGRTMSSVAAELGISRASLSSLATQFCASNGLPPSVYMRETK